MKKNSKVKTGTVIRGYILFPAICGVMLLALALVMFIMFDTRAGIMAMIAFAVYMIAACIFIAINLVNINRRLLKFADEYETMEGRFIEEMPIPYAIVDPRGKVLIRNKRFAALSAGETDGQYIWEVFGDLNKADLDFDGKEQDVSVVLNKRNYRLHFNAMSLPENMISEKIMVSEYRDVFIYALYVFDETEIINLYRTNAERKVLVGSLYVDNYNEVLDVVDEARKSLVVSMIDREVLNYFASTDNIIRKTEKDRYLLIFRRGALAGMQKNKFDLLDHIRAIDTGIDMPVTISMGIGVADTFQKCQDYANEARELALGRGGDQVVVKDGERTYFYGGKTKSVEKNTRVKARVKSISLREIISGRDKVVIMGHKIGDADCLGASIGMYKAARVLGKKAYIVLNELTNTVSPVLESFLDNPDYGEEVFVPVEKAPAYVDNNTTLVIVDVNNPDLFECPELITKTKYIVMIDHHLQTGVKVDNVVMSYIEPTASSASEMVTELLQYISADSKLTKAEAEALYAGILIDTNYFSKNTGVRTFEAAAFLRRNGVDVARVKGMFNDTLDDFKIKAEAIQTAEMFREGYAMAVCPSEGIENPTIVAAQVANELLEISGINASFVLLDYNNRIYISARSADKVNVQLIMEKMGGGGHLNSAGAQLSGETIEGAGRKLKLTVEKMIEEGIIS